MGYSGDSEAGFFPRCWSYIEQIQGSFLFFFSNLSEICFTILKKKGGGGQKTICGEVLIKRYFSIHHRP